MPQRTALRNEDETSKGEKMPDPTFPANNAQISDHFAAVYEATAHRITGLVSNTALDLVGVGPGTRILDIAAGAGALSGPAAERGATVLATDFAPGMVWRLAERLRPFRRCEARQMNGMTFATHEDLRRFSSSISTPNKRPGESRHSTDKSAASN